VIVSIHNHQLTIHHAKNTLLIVNHIPDYPDRVNALNYSDDETSMCLSKTRGHDSIGRLKWAPNVEVKPHHVAIRTSYIHPSFHCRYTTTDTESSLRCSQNSAS